jgi:hypothetical protein
VVASDEVKPSGQLKPQLQAATSGSERREGSEGRELI